MVKHQTSIDTVAIQLDYKTAIEQRNKFNHIYNWIIERKIGALKKNISKSNYTINAYDLMHGKSKLATIHTSFSKNYYIRIRWCGLKSYKLNQDKNSFNSLMKICALLNVSRTKYRFVELDIALDLFSPFNNILATCIKPVNNVLYNYVGYIQYFNGIPTSYIEDCIDKTKKKNAFKRSYLYNKSNKEGLDYSVTRFELKLQNRFFLRYGFNLNSIALALNKYAIFYFSDQKDKQFEVNQLISKNKIDSSDIFRLTSKYNRAYPNLDIVEGFIIQVESITVDFSGNVVFSKNLRSKYNNKFLNYSYLKNNF